MSDDMVRFALRIVVFMSVSIFGCIGALACKEGKYVIAATIWLWTILYMYLVLREIREGS